MECFPEITDKIRLPLDIEVRLIYLIIGLCFQRLSKCLLPYSLLLMWQVR